MYTPPRFQSGGIKRCTLFSSTFKVPVTKLIEFANSVDLDELAHHEPSHLDLHCLPSNLYILIGYGLNFFLKIYRREFCRLHFAS